VEQYARLLVGRGAEGLIFVDTAIQHNYPVPAVAVAAHRHIEGVTNVMLDQGKAAELALGHLYKLGHRSIAFMRGQPFSSDSEDRWRSIENAAKKLGLSIDRSLVVQLDRDLTSPELGYPVVAQLLAAGKRFSALFSFNDVAAIGAIRALRDAQLRVPEDVSVMGFDDIRAAAFITPSLTTIRQPLEDMGRMAARIVLSRIRNQKEYGDQVAVEPALMARESTREASWTPA
jgi:LacI family transcriptional regulator